MPRNRFVFTAPIVLAVIIIGVFAIRSRGDDSANVDTTPSRNCPPVARADAVATKPNTPIAIDVLANDTDRDGDPLVFQIRTTTGGDATNDDGGSPTDASDDRILFTPADPPPPQATVDYQAIDPDGALSESTVTITINPEGALPAGVASEPVPSGASSGGRCGGTGVTTSTSPTTTNLTTKSTTTPTTDEFGTITPAPTKPSKTSGRTTTTRKSTATTKAPGTTQPGSDTTQPHTTTTKAPTTTQPSGPPPTTPPECGDYPAGGSQAERDAWRQCVREHSGG
jgi:hypothetical protein